MDGDTGQAGVASTGRRILKKKLLCRLMVYNTLAACGARADEPESARQKTLNTPGLAVRKGRILKMENGVHFLSGSFSAISDYDRLTQSCARWCWC
jgi:hypothetical protein